MSELTELTFEGAERWVEDFYNETMEPIMWGNLTYSAGTALKRLDPIAFREEVHYWADELGWEFI